jgi:hypothetical protein
LCAAIIDEAKSRTRADEERCSASTDERITNSSNEALAATKVASDGAGDRDGGGAGRRVVVGRCSLGRSLPAQAASPTMTANGANVLMRRKPASRRGAGLS